MNNQEEKNIALSLIANSLMEFSNNKDYNSNFQIISLIKEKFIEFSSFKNFEVNKLKKTDLLQYLYIKNYCFVYEYMNVYPNKKSKCLDFKTKKHLGEKTLKYVIDKCINNYDNINTLENEIRDILEEEIKIGKLKGDLFCLEKMAKKNDKEALHKIFERYYNLYEENAKEIYQKYIELVRLYSKNSKKIVPVSYEDILQETCLYSYNIIKHYYANNLKKHIYCFIHERLKNYQKTLLNKLKKELDNSGNVYYDSEINTNNNIEAIEQMLTIKNELKSTRKIIFELLYQGYDAKQISKMLNLTLGSAKTETCNLRKEAKLLYKK